MCVGLGAALQLTAQTNPCPPPDPSVTQSGDRLRVQDGFDGYQWFRNGDPVEGATQATLIPDDSGQYAVEVQATSEAYAFSLSSREQPGWVRELGIGPNPTADVVSVHLGNSLPAAPLHLDVMDALGRTVIRRTLFVRELTAPVRVSLTAQPAGLYFIRLTDGQTQVSRKIWRQ